MHFLSLVSTLVAVLAATAAASPFDDVKRNTAGPTKLSERAISLLEQRACIIDTEHLDICHCNGVGASACLRFT